MNKEKPAFPIFTEEMKKDYTILVPTMIPLQIKLLTAVMRRYGYNAKMLENSGNGVIERGLKYVHNDICYPAQLVIGQLMEAVESGEYDTDKLALLITQTGGGCRASNYIHLLRRALEAAGYGHIPVISLNFSSIEKGAALKITPAILYKMMQAVLYGDLLMSLKNQTRPYAKDTADVDRVIDRWMEKLEAEMVAGKVSRRLVRENYRGILRDFSAIARTGEARRLRVGIVGEIFVKFSPLGNNNLEDFLVKEGAEVVLPGFFDFCFYCVYNSLVDRKLYGTNALVAMVYKIVYRLMLSRQKEVIRLMKEESDFLPPTPFDHTATLSRGFLDNGMKMGEGWLLTAEMVELIESGVGSIVCAQPFGCLPNHIAGKGMMKPMKEKYKNVNIVAIDYDSGASKINQENRIKLMLANARDVAEAQGAPAEEKEKQLV